MSHAYYNENDPRAAAWLRELIADRLIAPGDVDERSIVDVQPSDLDGYTQHHFFAGIGGWSYALRLAGWPDDRPVCTGSCPCQPFSVAGKGLGIDDKRHLWPEMFRLLRERAFPVVFGEQVAARAGREWLAGVRADLETLGYEVGCSDLCAAGAAAPHLRQRLYWVAYANRERRTGLDPLLRGEERGRGTREVPETARSGEPVRLANSTSTRCHGTQQQPESTTRDETRLRVPSAVGEAVRLGDDDDAGPQGQQFNRHGRDERAPWAASVGIQGSDGKMRRIEPEIFPLANGFSEALACMLSVQRSTWEIVERYATRTQTDPDQVLRMVREIFQPEPSGERPTIGVCIQFSASPLLFDLLLSAETARYRASDGSCGKKEGQQIVERAMRSLRIDSGIICPPCERESQGQRSDESPKTLPELSLLLARHLETYREAVLRAHAALSRTAIIRGAGNSIVPQLAAKFIEACEEARLL